MTRIVIYAHRYKRPPMKRAKAAAVEGIVTIRTRGALLRRCHRCRSTTPGLFG